MVELMDIDEALNDPGCDSMQVIAEHLEAGTNPQKVAAALRRRIQCRYDLQRDGDRQLATERALVAHETDASPVADHEAGNMERKGPSE